MSLLRGGSAIVRRILANHARCAVRVDRQYGKDPPPDFDFTHLEGKEQIQPLSLDESLTPERRAELAAKYNLRPEDYIPLNDKDLTLGDYPKLPYEFSLERDAYYDWDDPYFRRNWGEPIYHDADIMQPMYGVDTRPLAYDRPQMWKYFLFWFGMFVTAFAIGERYYYFPERAPKQYPETHPMDGVKAAVGSYDYMEDRYTPDAKLKERKEVVNYAFPQGWNPLAH